MGMVLMSKRELNRIDILARLDSGRLTPAAAAELLRVSERQVYRLQRRFREDGPAGIADRRRGRPSNNRLPEVLREHAVSLVRQHYADFGPTLAAEKLKDRHDLRVSRETLRSWMIQAGLWLPRAERTRFHQPRHRREHLGELIQIDGCAHRWFEDRGPPCTLLVFVDDATSRLMALGFVPSESTFAYFEVLRRYLEAHGKPVAFYSDKYSIFRVSQEEAAGGGGRRRRHDPVRPRLGGPQHRDPVRQLQPSQGTGGTRPCDLAGPAGQGTAAGGHQRSCGRQCVPAGLHGELQQQVRPSARPGSGSSSPFGWHEPAGR